MRTLALLALATCFMIGNRATAQELKVGDPAPNFESKSDDGKSWKSADHVGPAWLHFLEFDFRPATAEKLRNKVRAFPLP